MKPKVRVLIVTDDGLAKGGFLRWRDQAAAARKGVDARAFHLGEFIGVLTDTVWMGFDLVLTLAHRTTAAAAGLTEAQLKADRGADVVGFRFDQTFQVAGQAKTLADFDMILFFPIASWSSLTDAALQAEATAIAQFMEDGGGFFATGDHEDLGAPLARLIPRVRNMRRWWHPAGSAGQPAAPDGSGAGRHDTTQPGPDAAYQFEDQSDQFGQPITPSWYGTGFGGVVGGYFATFRMPHALLCSPDGVVNRLPDHMHEGWCEVPSDLSGTFTLGGSATPEYPALSGTPLAPEVVATGHVIGGHTTPAIDSVDHFSDSAATVDKTFGVIGAWDGHRVGKGRVVVDSTWHHFFEINLTGDLYLEGLVAASDQRLHGFYLPDGMGGRTPSPDYRLIQWYYRNIIYWLIPADRMSRIWWATLIELTSHHRFAEELTRSKLELSRLDEHLKPLDRKLDYSLRDLGQLLYFGQLAEAYLKKARGACTVAHVRVILYKPKIPWWEWVQEIVDPWGPVADRGRSPEPQFERLAGLGMAPGSEALLSAGLGLAVILAAQSRRAGGDASMEETARRVEAAWDHALPGLAHSFARQLRAGADLTHKFSEAVAGG